MESVTVVLLRERKTKCYARQLSLGDFQLVLSVSSQSPETPQSPPLFWSGFVPIFPTRQSHRVTRRLDFGLLATATNFVRSNLNRVLVRLVVVAVAAAVVGCYHQPESVLQRMSEAQRMAGRLHVDFTQASDATNLAVMAQSDEASAGFAQESERKMEAVQQDAEKLRPLLASLMFSNEAQLLDRFDRQLNTYRTVEQDILKLAVANDNLKAQRLSFGPAQKAADDFRLAIEEVSLSASGHPSQADALAFKALAALRQIQVLEAPHIAEARDDVMTTLERQMATAEAETRNALQSLAALTPANANGKIDKAKVALNRFLGCHRQIIALSRRNSNVRSLALVLGQRRKLTAQCEDTLEALTQELNKRGFQATR